MLRHVGKLLTNGSLSAAVVAPSIQRSHSPAIVFGAMICMLSLAACASSRPVTSTLDAEALNLPPGTARPETALQMRRGLSLPEGVLATVRPEGFDPTPTSRSDRDILPGVYVADDQYDDTYMVNRNDDPILDAALAELERSDPISAPAAAVREPAATASDPRLADRRPNEAPLNLYTANVPMALDPVAAPLEAGGFGVHITSYRSKDSIKPGLAHILSAYGRELEGLQAMVNLETVEGKGLFYRLKFGPFGSYEAALARCDRIKVYGEYCGVVGFDGEPL